MPPVLLALPVLAGAAGATAGVATGASALSVGLGALTAVSGSIGALGSYEQGQYQKKAGEAQATELEQQATLEKEQASAQIGVQDTKAMHLISRISASAAGAGLTPEGSPTLLASTSRQEQQISDMYTKQSGQLASMRDLYKAALARNQGKEQEAAGDVAAVGGLLTTGLNVAALDKGEFGQPYIS